VEQLATIFSDEWYCKNGLPLEIISDRDMFFTSKFWTSLHKLTSVKLKMSTLYHAQMDGLSEQTNKMLNQCIHFHVDHVQHGWKCALPCIRFNLMNTINASTGFSPFQLKLGHSPHVILPLVSSASNEIDDIRALDVIKRLKTDVTEAQANLTAAKISQTIYTNESCTDNHLINAGDHVLLSTLHRRYKYKWKGMIRTAKFMPHFDRPYDVTKVNHDHSTVILHLPNHPCIFPTFHMSQVIPFTKNDDSLFPSRELEHPPPIMIDDEEEFFIDHILDECKCGCSMQYLFHWSGYSPKDNQRLPTSALANCKALNIWQARQEFLSR
jgi:hypothetical protein